MRWWLSWRMRQGLDIFRRFEYFMEDRGFANGETGGMEVLQKQIRVNDDGRCPGWIV